MCCATPSRPSKAGRAAAEPAIQQRAGGARRLWGQPRHAFQLCYERNRSPGYSGTDWGRRRQEFVTDLAECECLGIFSPPPVMPV